MVRVAPSFAPFARITALAVLGIVVPGAAHAQANETLPPPRNPPLLHAARTRQDIDVDGRLEEPAWQTASTASPFRQVDPDQGAPPVGPTDVRVLFDDTYLYIAAVCHDPKGDADLRAPDLVRDFEPENHDLFSVVLDTLNDRRNAVTFQVNSYGAIRDVQVFDDELYDKQWDAVWKARTSRGPWGWTAEIAIPWKSLRYAPGTKKIGIQLERRLRRLNEISGWSPWPRGLSANRTSYAGYLVDIEPPQPPVNILLRPFGIVRSYEAEGLRNSVAPDAGLDIKWSPFSHTAVDLTINTDFGEAEVDRQVINLRRSAVFLPERRPFFLESSSLFTLGLEDTFQPFFSRRIGLTNDGRRVPMDFGARFVTRTPVHNAGGLVVRTRGTDDTAASTFTLARYSLNLGEQSRIGWFLSTRHDDATPFSKEVMNVVPAVDGLARIGLLTIRGLASTSYTNGPGRPAGFISAELKGNLGGAGTSTTYISERYDARTGFVSRKDMLLHQTYAWLDWRPSWKPRGVRSIGGEAWNGIYWNASDLGFQESVLYMEPVALLFDTTDRVSFKVERNWQRLTVPFAPLSDLEIPAGEYQYGFVAASLRSDPSRKLALQIEGQSGEFYTARYQGLNTELRASPVPNLSLVVAHNLNRFNELPGPPRPALLTHLFRSELRLALSPRVQLSAIVQYNSDLDLLSGNARFSWEFQPLSFFYVIYTDVSRGRDTTGLPLREQQLLFKGTYAWQL